MSALSFCQLKRWCVLKKRSTIVACGTERVKSSDFLLSQWKTLKPISRGRKEPSDKWPTWSASLRNWWPSTSMSYQNLPSYWWSHTWRSHHLTQRLWRRRRITQPVLLWASGWRECAGGNTGMVYVIVVSVFFLGFFYVHVAAIFRNKACAIVPCVSVIGISLSLETFSYRMLKQNLC